MRPRRGRAGMFQVKAPGTPWGSCCSSSPPL